MPLADVLPAPTDFSMSDTIPPWSPFANTRLLPSRMSDPEPEPIEPPPPEPRPDPPPRSRPRRVVPLTCSRIRELRQALGLTQTQLGDKCTPPVPQPHIARAEQRHPGLRLLARIACALEVDPGVLVQRNCAACGSPLLVYETGDGLVCSRIGCGWFVR